MNVIGYTESLWGKKAKFYYLVLAAIALYFIFLGSRELWTQEYRWADIVGGMFQRHDFFHPYLNNTNYYDKPLLSYWLMAGVAYVLGDLSTWALRIPSAVAGLLAVGSIYQIGKSLKNQQLGFLAAWMFLTTYYCIFWARTSSADMLNLAGSLLAIAWYFTHKSAPKFSDYSIFFLIVALTALCKGLIGVAVPFIAVLSDCWRAQEWRQHLNMRSVTALLLAAMLYLLPFALSSYLGKTDYSENGLYLVYRENILRFFQPFDHQGSVYLYFIYLPLYMLPWTAFFIPLLLTLSTQWRLLSRAGRWAGWVTLLLFLMLTCSGSRRSYYVLPLVPFALLMTADWILSAKAVAAQRWAARLILIMLTLAILLFDIMLPFYSAQGGTRVFAKILHAKLALSKYKQPPNFVLLDAENKVRFYLKLPTDVKNYLAKSSCAAQNTVNPVQTWPILKNIPRHTIFISRQCYQKIFSVVLPDYQCITTPPTVGERLFHVTNPNAPIALIPKVDF